MLKINFTDFIAYKVSMKFFAICFICVMRITNVQINSFPNLSHKLRDGINMSKNFDLDYAILNIVIQDLAKLNYNVEKVILN